MVIYTMLRISNGVDYSVRIMVHLAALGAGGVERIENIARHRSLPAPYVRRLVAPLIRAGLVGSVRGAAGGLRLGHPPEHISLLTIIEAVDGPLLLRVCQTQRRECPFSGACPVQTVWSRLGVGLRDQLQAISLVDLAGSAAHQRSHRRHAQPGIPVPSCSGTGCQRSRRATTCPRRRASATTRRRDP